MDYENQTFIIAGPYGSGKSEFCVQFAKKIRNDFPEAFIQIADYDIINPYFRSREKKDYLKDYNIAVIGSNLNNNVGQDIPAVSANISENIYKKGTLLIDLGGSINGLNPLISIKDSLLERPFSLYVVINVFRNYSDSKDKIIEFIKNVEAMTNLKVNGIINNGNLISMTTHDDIQASQKNLEEISEFLSIPIVYTMVERKFCETFKANNEILAIDELLLREKWM